MSYYEIPAISRGDMAETHSMDIQEGDMQKYDYQRKRRTALPEYISVISANK